MDQNISASSSDMSQSQHYDPRKVVSRENLIAIIASHEKLQQWNNATEAALKTDWGHSDTKLIQNIRNTAALIAASGRSVRSQNFELMGAMNISDSTLSKAGLASGFIEGILSEVTSPLRDLADIQQPGDMNLEHSVKRAEMLESSIMQLGSNMQDVIATATQSAWEHPDKVVKILAGMPHNTLDSYQQSVAKIPEAIENSLTAKNPEQALGFSFGVAAVGMIRNTATSSGRKMRDFSDQMKFEFLGDSGKVSTVTYKPDEGHFIIGHVTSGTLRYEIKKSDGDRWGHGNEMLGSLVDKFEKNGVAIERIQGAMMTEGPSSSIGHQYLKALAAGHAPEEAAFMTLTGQQAKIMGMKHVIVPPMAPLDKSLHPLFTKEPLSTPKTEDKHSSLTPQIAGVIIMAHLKTLGLPPEKEQLVIAHIEKKLDAASHENARSV